jgi:type IV secretion system protein VirD4
VFAGFGIALIGGIIAIVKNVSGNKEDMHGSAKLAERKDFKEFENKVESGSFILASADPNKTHGKLVLPRSLTVMHGLILGGSGTGKSRGYFMPNCAEAENTSLVVTDPKSELWNYTSGFQRNPMRYAPTEPESSFCFNWIPLCADARISELCARAIMTAGSTQKTDQFWIDAETAFLSAIFSHTATMTYPTPLTSYKLFTRQKPEELLQQLLKSPSYVAREQAIIFEQTDARIKGAIVPAVASRMQFMRDKSIQLFTSGELEAPHFGQLRHTPTAVYWCLREQDIARLRPLTSLFFTVLLEQIAGEQIPEGASGIPINLMLDEFANIGKIPDFETTISLARGRGVALWLGIQSLSQLTQNYGTHEAQTIISNCATKIALHGLDFQTAEYVSRMLGETTITHSRNSFSVGMSGVSVGSGQAEHRRQLLTPDEVMRIGENEAIARTSNKYPMRLYKGYYNAEPKTAPITHSLSKIQTDDEEIEATLI